MHNKLGSGTSTVDGYEDTFEEFPTQTFEPYEDDKKVPKTVPRALETEKENGDRSEM